MRISKKAGGLVLAVVVATGGGVVAAQSAQADPSGCTTNKPTITDNGAGLLTGKGTATCRVSATRTLVGEIKWDKNLFPDPKTASNSTYGSKKSYSVTVKTCDHQNKRKYYARTFFSSGSDYHDSTHKTIKTC
jgi:hypothetical protein